MFRTMTGGVRRYTVWRTTAASPHSRSPLDWLLLSTPMLFTAWQSRRALKDELNTSKERKTQNTIVFLCVVIFCGRLTLTYSAIHVGGADRKLMEKTLF